MKRHTDVLIFHTQICAGASQICLMAAAPSRKRSGMEILMILLRANQGLRQTFDKLIRTMKVPVKWSGIFAVIDNYIILQGEVRSLFFHFDSRRMVTNIIDLTVKEEEVKDTADNVQVQNVINMILYAFGKWGTLGGLTVEKNYAQLNRLFSGIMREFGVEPEYSQEHFYFYKDRIRITYEDVMQLALEYEEAAPEEVDGEEGGLWHKLIWKKEQTRFSRVETSLKERQKERLGNNFYMVGYLCPACGEKLHMAVYPEGREFKIATDEGAVLLARACTCNRCRCYYAARPKRLLSDGDVYVMRFGDDGKAYDDYLELMGKSAQKTSNCGYNRYADGREERREDGEAELAELCENIEERPDSDLEYLADRMEEGFYRPESVRRFEGKIKSQRARRKKEREKEERRGAGGREARRDRKGGDETGRRGRDADDAAAVSGSASLGRGTKNGREETDGGRLLSGSQDKSGRGKADAGEAAGVPETAEETASGSKTISGRSDAEVPAGKRRTGSGNTDKQDALREKYEARFAVMDRLSDRQLGDLRNQLARDTRLAPDIQREFLGRVDGQISKERAGRLRKKIESCEGKSYAVMQKVLDEADAEGLLPEHKKPLLDDLREKMRRQGALEAEERIKKMPAHPDRAEYHRFVEELRRYKDVDLSGYEEKLRAGRREAEQREIARIVKRAEKGGRADLAALAEKLQKEGFLPELVAPYLDKINAKIRQMDMESIAALCPPLQSMSFAEGMEAYEQIRQGGFLPELVADALTTLTKRLSKIKSDECELLVKKLQEELKQAGVGENDRHHFYPAAKVLSNEAAPEETEVIDYAMASYAAGRGLFEYPIMVADTSRNRSGKEGMILTPDHLYYCTMFHAYGIPMSHISEITYAAGLLNRGVYVHQKDGTRVKIPCAVDTREMKSYAQVLEEFVRYLQEKPDSRNVNYLAKEKHDQICCFRCGHVYGGGDVCPRCGYKNNDS